MRQIAIHISSGIGRKAYIALSNQTNRHGSKKKQMQMVMRTIYIESKHIYCNTREYQPKPGITLHTTQKPPKTALNRGIYRFSPSYRCSGVLLVGIIDFYREQCFLLIAPVFKG